MKEFSTIIFRFWFGGLSTAICLARTGQKLPLTEQYLSLKRKQE